MKDHTKTGLLLLLLSIIFGMITGILLFILSFTQEITNINNLLAALIPVIIPGAIGGFLGLIGLILIMVGRKDYGEQHSKFAIYALIIFIISIIISVIISIVQSFTTYSSSLSATSGLQNLPLIMAINTIISAILSGLMYIFLLYHLENEKGRIILYAAVFTSIFFSIIISIYNYLNLSEIFSTIDLESSSSAYGSMINYIFSLSKISILGLVGNILFLIAIYIPYNRIKSGELVNVLPSYLKKCMGCGRVSRSDYTICPYCGKRYFDNK